VGEKPLMPTPPPPLNVAHAVRRRGPATLFIWSKHGQVDVRVICCRNVPNAKLFCPVVVAGNQDTATAMGSGDPTLALISIGKELFDFGSFVYSGSSPFLQKEATGRISSVVTLPEEVD